MKKNVNFITLSRSDYASLKNVIEYFLNKNVINVTVTAGGSHLLKRYGLSIKEINNDRITINHKINFLEEGSDEPFNLINDLSIAIKKFNLIFKNNRPDFIFIFGDRWEIMAPCLSAFMQKIPIIHHSGGDITEGSADNQIRYSLTNFSHLHLVSLLEHKNRLINVGEESWRIKVCGEPALNKIKKSFNKKNKIIFNKNSNSNYVLATYHPCSYETLSINDQINIFLESLKLIDEDIILTAPNPDAYSGLVYKKFFHFCQKHQKIKFVENLGNDYYSILENCSFMFGNSSSGIWESPSFKKPSINIGPRQDGRIKSKNTINSKLNITDLRKAIRKVNSKSFLDSIESVKNPYYKKNCFRIIEKLITKDYNYKKLISKKFIDV